MAKKKTASLTDQLLSFQPVRTRNTFLNKLTPQVRKELLEARASYQAGKFSQLNQKEVAAFVKESLKLPVTADHIGRWLNESH